MYKLRWVLFLPVSALLGWGTYFVMSVVGRVVLAVFHVPSWIQGPAFTVEWIARLTASAVATGVAPRIAPSRPVGVSVLTAALVCSIAAMLFIFRPREEPLEHAFLPCVGLAIGSIGAAAVYCGGTRRRVAKDIVPAVLLAVVVLPVFALAYLDGFAAPASLAVQGVTAIVLCAVPVAYRFGRDRGRHDGQFEGIDAGYRYGYMQGWAQCHDGQEIPTHISETACDSRTLRDSLERQRLFLKEQFRAETDDAATDEIDD